MTQLLSCDIVVEPQIHHTYLITVSKERMVAVCIHRPRFFEPAAKVLLWFHIRPIDTIVDSDMPVVSPSW